MTITFILGGARSGKSAYAEAFAEQSGRKKIYLATAEALDAEMCSRIAKHQARRAGWDTWEVPVAIAETISNAPKNAVILVDCLTLWLSNLMYQELDIAVHTQALIETLKRTQAQVLLVSNEVGQGIVPDNALARKFRDEAGLLHQKIAATADRVVFITAGLPSILKGN